MTEVEIPKPKTEEVGMWKLFYCEDECTGGLGGGLLSIDIRET